MPGETATLLTQFLILITLGLSMDQYYGPQNPNTPAEYTEFQTPSYLTGHAKKIRLDLERIFRLYSGKLVKLLQLQKSSDRCPECTDQITGQVLLTNCPVCNGSGYTLSYADAGDYWALADIGAALKLTGETGNSQNTRTGKDQFVLVGAPPLGDKDLLVFVDTKDMYKVVDAEPQIVALVGLSYLTIGSNEYRYVTW